MIQQLTICDEYPCATSTFQVIEWLDDAPDHVTQFDPSLLQGWKLVTQQGDYLEARRMAREHCLVHLRECWVVDVTDNGCVALRTHPAEYSQHKASNAG